MDKDRPEKDCVEYRLVGRDGDLDVGREVMLPVFKALNAEYADVCQVVDYTLYRQKGMELTHYANGSCFNHHVRRVPLKNVSSLKNILMISCMRTRVDNDLFEPDYVYDEIVDIIEVVFPMNGHEVVLSVKHADRPITLKNIFTVDKTGWCEICVRAECGVDVSETLEKLIKISSNYM